MKEKIPQRFACCIPVKGKRNSLICDVQRKSFHPIPNELYEILTDLEGYSLTAIKAHYQHQYDAVIEDYFQFLVEHQYVFFTDHPERFPALSLDWEEPATITNAIIDVGMDSLPLEDILQQLSELQCRHILIRAYAARPQAYWEQLLDWAAPYPFLSIDVQLPFSESLSDHWLENLCQRFPQLFLLLVHGAPQSRTGKGFPKAMGNVLYTSTVMDSETHCGAIHPYHFSVNVKTFTESQQHNSCLNRKISVDQHGQIKNCPSLAQSYGDIRNTSLRTALAHPDFRQYWQIKKDDIAGCKDCEFRYICTDCRAYREDPADLYSKPLKCGYDPATGQWEDWSENPLKQQTLLRYAQSSRNSK